MRRKNRGFPWLIICLLVALVGAPVQAWCAQEPKAAAVEKRIEQEVTRLMEEGNIPGLSLVILKDGRSTIRSYGYSDVATKTPVTPRTLFEIGSCSKAFTALAMLKLATDKNLDLDAPVSKYLPWFKPTYETKAAAITIRQLLHHTSGIPWETISTIPQRSDAGALEQTVKNVAAVELSHRPGTTYEYATINYDVVALIIQTVAGVPFEQYLQLGVIDALQMRSTRIGQPIDSSRMATGYKISFLDARAYQAPAFAGNNAAGYVISDATDISQWLAFQLGMSNSSLYPLAKQTQRRDETVAPIGLLSYGMGWQVSLSGNGEINHGGINPNFTSYMAFRPEKNIGVAILTNSSSNLTPFIGDEVIKLLAGESIKDDQKPDAAPDKVFTLIGVVLCGYLVLVAGLLLVTVGKVVQGQVAFQAPGAKTALSLAASVLVITPVLYSIYLLPNVLGFSWQAVRVWSSDSFITMVFLVVAALGVSYLSYLLAVFFPGRYHFKKDIPRIILISIVSGLANMALILLITSSLKDAIDLEYLTFYYVLFLLVYLLGRRFVQLSLIKITSKTLYDIRVELIDKIFSSSYQNFEKIDKGRIYATLNDDVGMLGNAANMIVSLVSSTITAAGIFLYLATLELWATLITLGLIVAISLLYTSVSKRAQVFFDKARDSQNRFMHLLGGLIDGAKELGIQRNKKLEYKADIASTASLYNQKNAEAQTNYLYTSLIGELSLLTLLGFVAFGISKLLPEVKLNHITNFIILLLYLNGPLNIILNSVPGIMQLRVAWKRIQSFLREIPSNINLQKLPVRTEKKWVESIRAEGLVYRYQNEQNQETFSVGPVDLEVKRGEILFVVGGNGSGKTTLAKMITGLYTPVAGTIYINDEEVSSAELSEYFSAVFSPCYIFEKLYNVETAEKTAEIELYLKLLGLSEKVSIRDNHFSTVNLSSGQRKRLAMLQCYLEDSPIFLFDEWAADQDPEYRRFFYRVLLPEMRRKEKIVIAITHDDHYFDVADKVLKMDVGHVEYVSTHYKVDELLSSVR